MPAAVETSPFTPNAVFIPDSARWTDHGGDHVDPGECVLLMVDGDNHGGEVFTEDGWLNRNEPLCRREWGAFTDVEGGTVELLPEMCVVKIDEREYWHDPEVLAGCPRIYGVYVFDRRQHFHLCSFEACYELHFLGSQYEESPALEGDEYRRDEISRKIGDGDIQSGPVTYWSKYDIDEMLQHEIEEGYLPPFGRNGGYRLSGIVSVTTEDAIEEAREAHCACPL